MSRTMNLLVLFFLMLSCVGKSRSRSIDVYSYQISDRKHKMEILDEYVEKDLSGVVEAEYHIWFKDNSGMLPGPSDYDIVLALQLTPDHFENWIDGVESSDAVPIDRWTKLLRLDSTHWDLTSKPETYRSGNTQIKLVFRKQNIVLAAYSTMAIGNTLVSGK